jgi:hypothetical protein
MRAFWILINTGDHFFVIWNKAISRKFNIFVLFFIKSLLARTKVSQQCNHDFRPWGERGMGGGWRRGRDELALF